MPNASQTAEDAVSMESAVAKARLQAQLAEAEERIVAIETACRTRLAEAREEAAATERRLRVRVAEAEDAAGKSALERDAAVDAAALETKLREQTVEAKRRATAELTEVRARLNDAEEKLAVAADAEATHRSALARAEARRMRAKIDEAAGRAAES